MNKLHLYTKVAGNGEIERGCLLSDTKLENGIRRFDSELHTDPETCRVRLGTPKKDMQPDPLSTLSEAASSGELLAMQDELYRKLRGQETGPRLNNRSPVSIVSYPDNSGICTTLAHLINNTDHTKDLASTLSYRMEAAAKSNRHRVPHIWSICETWPTIVPTTLIVCPKDRMFKWCRELSTKVNLRTLVVSKKGTLGYIVPIDTESVQLPDSPMYSDSSSEEEVANCPNYSNIPLPQSIQQRYVTSPSASLDFSESIFSRSRNRRRFMLPTSLSNIEHENDEIMCSLMLEQIDKIVTHEPPLPETPLAQEFTFSVQLAQSSRFEEMIEPTPVNMDADVINLLQEEIDVVIIPIDLLNELYDNCELRNTGWSRLIVDQAHTWTLDKYYTDPPNVNQQLPLAQTIIAVSPVANFMQRSIFPAAFFPSINRLLSSGSEHYDRLTFKKSIRSLLPMYTARYEVTKYHHRGCASRQSEESEFRFFLESCFAQISGDFSKWFDPTQEVSRLMDKAYKRSVREAKEQRRTGEPVIPLLILPAAVYGEIDDVRLALSVRFENNQVPWKNREEEISRVRDRIMGKLDRIHPDNTDERCFICRECIAHRRPTVYMVCCTAVFCMPCVKGYLMTSNNGYNSSGDSMRCPMCTTPVVPSCNTAMLNQMIAETDTQTTAIAAAEAAISEDDESEPLVLAEIGFTDTAGIAGTGEELQSLLAEVEDEYHRMHNSAYSQYFDSHMFVLCEPMVDSDELLLDLIKARTNKKVIVDPCSDEARFGKWSDLEKKDIHRLYSTQVSKLTKETLPESTHINVFDHPNANESLKNMVEMRKYREQLLDRIIGPKLCILCIEPHMSQICSYIESCELTAYCSTESSPISPADVSKCLKDRRGIFIFTTDVNSASNADLSAVTDLIVYGSAHECVLTWPLLAGKLVGLHRYRRLNIHYL